MDREQPAIGSAEETAIFVQPRGQVFVTMLWVIAVAHLFSRGFWLLVTLLVGVRPDAGDIGPTITSLIVVPTVAAAVCVLVAWNRLGWLHSSMHGLEFAATGRRGVSIPWSGVAAVALRHRGVFTELVVTPTSPGVVTELPGKGRRPRRRGDAFLVDIGLMSPGPDTLLAELHRRMPSKV